MKRIIFLILLVVAAGCKVVQKPSNKADIKPKTSEEMPVDVPLSAPVEDLTDKIQNIADTIIEHSEVAQVLADTVSNIIKTDSVLSVSDSLTSAMIPTDSLAVDTVKKKGALEAMVEYKAKDSIVWTAGNMAYMYGESDVKYLNIELTSEFIQMNMDSSVVYASYGVDSTGEQFGNPILKEGEQDYDAETMRYNFKTRKAIATNVVTKEGEGFVTAKYTKKLDDNVMNMADGKYTTCDAEEPHFYLHMSKAKVRPGKDIVTGPVNLVIEDVPLPIALPFMFFPFTDTYSSGIIMPSYGDEMTRGFFLRDGGYYLALSDYFDLALTGEIYTKGSWGLSGKTSYKKRYKYSGNFSTSYLVTKTGDKGLPDYSKSKAFKLTWSHTQDAKANPYRTFSASIDFSTNSYDRNQLRTLYTPAATQNNKGSSVSISQRFPNKPFSISATMNINQRSSDSTVSVTLPDMTFTLSRIYPFKRKNAVGKERLYEKISLSYTGHLKNSLQNTKEDRLLKASLIKEWQNGMQHSVPISLTTTIFDYINISPSINYSETWLTHKVKKVYEPSVHKLVAVDTTYGFYRLYNYNASLSASTTLYGFFTPWKMFQNKVRKIRHRMDLSLSYSAAPDFGAAKYGYYENYSYLDGSNPNTIGGNPTIYTGSYSPFEGQLYAPPGRGKSGTISFTVDNNIEAKIASESDSTGEKKISLIEKLSGSMSYNMAADSMNWSDLSINMRLKWFKTYPLNFNMVFDTYTYGYNEKTNTPYRMNKPRWTVGKGIGRLRSTGTSFSYTLNNETIKKWFGGGDDNKKDKKERKKSVSSDYDEYGPENPDDIENEDFNNEEREGKEERGHRHKKQSTEGDYDENGYYKTNIPWSLQFSYNISVAYDQASFNKAKMEYDYKYVQALTFSGSIQPTKNWRVSFNATYDFDNKKISYLTCNLSRTMHCWQMSASIIPIGPLKSYSFTIAASASMLQDLKYQQSSNYRDGATWY